MPYKTGKALLKLETMDIPVRLHVIEEAGGLRRTEVAASASRASRWEGPRMRLVEQLAAVAAMGPESSSVDGERKDGKDTDVVHIHRFTDEEGAEQLPARKAYYVTPMRESRKDYERLRDTLGSAHRIGISRVRINEQDQLGILFPHAKLLVLNVLTDPRDRTPDSTQRRRPAA